MSDALSLTAAAAAARIRAGELDAAELWHGYRARAAADELNAFTWVAGDGGAPAADPASPLAGVPVAVKDLFCTAGVPSQAGSRILEGYRPPYTATSIARLAGAGAPLLGKTNQDEFAMGSSTENSAYGPTLNPWDTGRVPGGSSGGSAAAVAAGSAPWAIGTDTGGSIRQPAALCGIVGLKPTYGAVSRYGMIAFASSLDQAGTFTRDVTDAALLFGAMAGKDPCDSTSVGLPGPIEPPARTDLRGIRLGVPEELSGEGIEAGVLAAFRQTLDVARELGATVETLRLPHSPHALSAYYLIAPAEASSNLARYDGVRYGFRAEGVRDLLQMYTETREQGFGPEVKRRIMLGTYALVLGLLRRLLRPGPAGAHADQPRLRRGLGAGRLRRHPDGADRRLRARREDGRPAGHVPQRRVHGADVARRHPGHLDPQRAERRAAGRLPARRPGVQRERAARRRARARAGDRLHRRTMDAGRMTEYEPVIGLEIHVQLDTRTKMFCGCGLSFGEPPNTRTCPVCLGLPGTLPVVNAQAVHFALMMGLALGCEIAPRSIFHRKNYFYPDQAKNYQISQYDIPICLGGHLGDVRLHRIHLEEDAAKLVHVGESGRIHGADASIVDYNRGGTPLCEIVTEPDLHSAEQARDWLNLLRVTLRQLGVSDVNMEEGSLRCDANVSVRPVGTTELGTKTELKNMNSFRFLERGVNAEIERQVALLEAGEPVVQETLHFDPASGRLSSLRSKEEAHDYRYFPEPDLVPLVPTEEMLAAARAALPELPAERAARYAGDWGLAEDPARLLAYEPQWGDYFETVATAGDDGKAAANWVEQLRARIGADADPAASNVTPQALARLVALVAAKEINAGTGRDVLDRLVAAGGDPAEIVEREGLGSMGGGDELAGVVAAAIAANEGAAERVRGGNDKAMGPIVGFVMRETKGRADGGEVGRLIREQLGIQA